MPTQFAASSPGPSDVVVNGRGAAMAHAADLANALRLEEPMPVDRARAASVLGRRALRLVNRLRANDGTTLVEMLVVIAMLGILTGVTTMIFGSFFSFQLKAAQAAEQDATSQVFNGFLAANLADAQEHSLALEEGDGIDPISLANDQFVFVSDERCYRVFYVERAREIKVATSKDVVNDCAEIKPERGPNEEVEPTGYVITDPSDPLYDWVLDDPANGAPSSESRVFSLADRVDADLGPFRFLDSANEELATDYQASSLSSNPAYGDPEIAEIVAVSVSASILATENIQATIKAKPRKLERVYYLDQAPAIS